MNKYLIIVLLLSAIILIATIILIGYYYFENYKKNQKRIKETIYKLKKNLQVFSKYPYYEIFLEEKQIIETYSFNPTELPHEQYRNWRFKADPLEDLCQFSIVLLYNSIAPDEKSLTNSEVKKLKIVEDAISRILKVLPRKIENDKPPWGNSWRVFWITLPTLLAIYQVVGYNDELKSQCHSAITKLIPSVDYELKFRDFHPIYDFMNISIPRLSTNYIFNKTDFESDLKNAKFIEFNNYLRRNYRKEVKKIDGIYEDLTPVMNGDVINYQDFYTRVSSLLFSNYYVTLFKTINVSINLYALTEEITKKLFHPTVSYTPVGLLSYDASSDDNYQRWNIDGILGVFIIPFGGIGIFKTERFMFSLRIQRPEFVSFEKTIGNSYPHALAWIQLRKFYFSRQTHYKRMTEWNILKNEPGVMSFTDDSCPVSTYNTDSKKFYSSMSKTNYIGRLKTSNVMFWKSEYYIEDLINCHVIEVGVVTDNGLESVYKIHNRYDKAIKFCYDDTENSSNLKCLLDEKLSLNIQKGCVVIAMNETVSFHWRMLIDDTIKNEITCDSSENNLKFKYLGNNYLVESQNMPDYLTVKKDDEVILIGSSNPKKEDVVYYEKCSWKRDVDTMMYEKSVK